MHIITTNCSLYRTCLFSTTLISCFIQSLLSINFKTIPSKLYVTETMRKKGSTNQIINPAVNNDMPCIIENDLCFCTTTRNTYRTINGHNYYHRHHYFGDDDDVSEGNRTNRTDVEYTSNAMSNFLSICCQPKVVRLHFYGSGIKFIKPEIFTQFACHEVVELTLESTMISMSSVSSSITSLLTSPKQYPPKTLTNPNYFIGLPNLIRLRLINNPRIQLYASGIFTGISSNLQELYLTGNPVKQISVEDFNKFTAYENRLTSLDLSYNQIAIIEPKCFSGTLKDGGMYHLRRLNLAHNHLSIIKVNMFSGLSYLEELNLAENPIMHIEEESFRNLISLRKLVIEGTVKMVYNKTIETFTREMFKDLKDLQDLTLVGLQLQSLNTDTFTDLYQLRRLNLARNRFTKVPVIHNHDHEDETNFSMDVVSPQTALIFPITIKTKLIYLNLSHNQITCLQPSAFQYLYKLKHLIMNFNRINIITRDAFIGLHSLQILELQGNPLTFIQPYAFIPVKISLKSLFLSDIISEEHGNVIKYLNRTSFALLTTATKIIGLEKWNIFTGCNQTIDIMLSSNKHYTKDIGKDIKCEADVELITKMLIDPKITEVASSSVNAEREHEESELSFTQINDSVIHDNLNESQNIVIIIFGSGMSLIIILLILLMLYRLYAYKLKSKDTKHTSSTYLKSKEKTFCLEKGSSGMTTSVNSRYTQSHEKIIKSENMNNVGCDDFSHHMGTLTNLHIQNQLFEPITSSFKLGSFISNSTQSVPYNNNYLNYNWSMINPFQSVNILMNTINQNENHVNYTHRQGEQCSQKRQQRKQYDGVVMNLTGSPQTTYLSDDSYNLISVNNNTNNDEKEIAQSGSSLRLQKMYTIKSNSQKSEIIYPHTIYKNSMLRPLNQSCNENVYGDENEDEDGKPFIKELGII